MAIAKMRVLEENEYDDNERYEFKQDLMLWARNWIPEIAIGIASEADELFENPAIRILVAEYAKAKRHDLNAFEEAWERAIDGKTVEPSDFHGIYHSDVAGYSDALYLLLVK